MKKRIPVLVKITARGRFQRLLDPSGASARLKSGSVTLAPGEDIGLHVTLGKEELLIVLQGRALVRCEGFKPIMASGLSCVYIPARTAHNVINTGSSVLHYVYVVCPVGRPARATCRQK